MDGLPVLPKSLLYSRAIVSVNPLSSGFNMKYAMADTRKQIASITNTVVTLSDI